jgi:hypothetical protein
MVTLIIISMTNIVIKCLSKNTSIHSSLDDIFKMELERNIYLILIRSIIKRGKTGIFKKRKKVLNVERGLC